MEESKEKGNSDEKKDKGSNSCVMDLSIEGGNGEEEFENIKNKNEIDNSNSLNKSFDDIKNFTKKLNLKDNFENILDIDIEETTNIQEQNLDGRKNRSKTFKITKTTNKIVPKPKPIIIDEYIKPLKLNSNKSIIRDNSEKDLIECKSCDDKSDKDKNYFNYVSNDDSEDEIKNNLKINTIKKIKYETKNIKYDCKLNCLNNNEFENILNIEKIFLKNVYNNNIYEDVLIVKNKNIQNRNKRKFWHKHINIFKKKLNAIKNDEKSNNKEFTIKRSDTFSKKNNHEGLFLLGVLESAAKDKKRRKTMHNNNRTIKNLQKEEDEK